MKLFSKLTAILALSAMTLAGCMEGMVEEPALLSAEERQLRQIERERNSTAIAIGAAAGAVLGAAATRDCPRDQQQKKCRDEQMKGMLIGAIIGGMAGSATGSYVNARAREFSSEQNGYRASIAAADQDIRNYQSLNQTTSRLVSQQRSKVSRLNGQLRQGSISEKEYRVQIASARANVRSIDDAIGDISKQIQVMRDDSNTRRANGKPTGDLNNRINSLEAQKRTLESRRREMADVYDDVPASVGSYQF